ncbi:heme-binding protein [Mycolicibacterium palauense]|uniref:heme-binding protein n=1 Tax=Mycolicibacterium palauense TaxID=2034511 RepID=UPI000BFEEEA5|nr:heme-binding protein [Mycolicibacterium palauense]
MSGIIRSAAIAALAGAALLGSAATASADDPPPPPNCTLADMSGVLAGVSTAMSAYMFTHPEVNNFMTGLAHEPSEVRKAAIDTYLDANPQVNAEIAAIRQPMKDFRTRCGMSQPDEPRL